MTDREMMEKIFKDPKEALAAYRQRLTARVEGLIGEYPANFEHPEYEQDCREWEIRKKALNAVLKLIAEEDL